MQMHTITFERLAKDFGVGTIRSITIDHTRGILSVVCDDNGDHIEGQTIKTGIIFSSQDEV